MTEPRPAAAGRRLATVRDVSHPTPRGVVLRMEIADRVEHLPGQHYVVRLVAEDGYVAQRSYSVSSAPSDPLVELFVERLDDGEVSTYLADVVEPGDQLQVQGPIGRYFIWDADRPAFGLGGGSGVVPLVAMLRHAADKGRSELLRLAVSSRTLADLPYADELMAAGALVALSRENAPTGRLQGRLTAAELEPYVRATDTCFICGSNAFAEAASELLLERGVPASAIRVERFGPSG